MVGKKIEEKEMSVGKEESRIDLRIDKQRPVVARVLYESATGVLCEPEDNWSGEKFRIAWDNNEAKPLRSSLRKKGTRLSILPKLKPGFINGDDQPYIFTNYAEIDDKIDRAEEFANESDPADKPSGLYLSREAWEAAWKLLETRKAIILQGPPGTGKTYTARELARVFAGDKSRVEFTQFHQSTTYEDFIYGFRPTANGGFEAKRGLFYRFCEEANDNSEQKYVLIIDEINRANISKVFGEVLMLLEYRGEEVELPFSDENGAPRKISIPENVYIIGCMNTADKSLAILDHALRRRFSFVDVPPVLDKDRAPDDMKELVGRVIELNKKIANHPDLGEGFCIGHSYFVGGNAEELGADIIREYQLKPIIDEYLFDDPNTAKEWKKILGGEPEES